MTVISVNLIKELRERTGAGMGDCKKALEAVGGDLDKAAEKLRGDGSATSPEENALQKRYKKSQPDDRTVEEVLAEVNSSEETETPRRDGRWFLYTRATRPGGGGPECPRGALIASEGRGRVQKVAPREARVRGSMGARAR